MAKFEIKKWCKLFLLTFLYVFINSCSKDKENILVPGITSTLIGVGNLYGNGAENITQQNLIITNLKDWNNLKNQMNIVNNVSESFNETGIDFSSCKIIASFDEIKGNGGHTIDNTMITENENNVIITILRANPSGNATTVITQPFKIILIPMITKPIVFN